MSREAGEGRKEWKGKVGVLDLLPEGIGDMEEKNVVAAERLWELSFVHEQDHQNLV